MNSETSMTKEPETKPIRRRRLLLSVFAVISSALMIFGYGCGPSTESTKTETTAPVVATKEMLYQLGHKQYLHQHLDSAQATLSQAFAMDANYKEVIAVLAPLQYDLAMRSDVAKKKNDLLRKSRDYYAKLETLGDKESETYERLCEIATTLNDDKTFLKYAKKNVEAYPYDRQYYNVSVAYANIEDWNNLIATAKKAVDKFRESPFIGSFYRQLGRGYMKIDRDQTAEKTFYTGLAVIDGKMAEMRKGNPDYKTAFDYSKLKDDKASILISLKNLHTTYKATDKLADVEKKLKELGR